MQAATKHKIHTFAQAPKRELSVFAVADKVGRHVVFRQTLQLWQQYLLRTFSPPAAVKSQYL